MVSLKHDSDKMFGVFMCNTTYIGHLMRRADKKWFFQADIDRVPDYILSGIDGILETLNL